MINPSRPLLIRLPTVLLSQETALLASQLRGRSAPPVHDAAAQPSSPSSPPPHPPRHHYNHHQRHDHVQQLLLPLDRIRVVAASVLLALDGLHSRGIAHLALEAPRHLLLSATGRLMLGGLSSAAPVGSRNHLGRLRGAACCTAPELLRRTRSGRAPRVAVEADLYSVGVLVGLCAFGWAERDAEGEKRQQGEPGEERQQGEGEGAVVSPAEAAGLVVVGSAAAAAVARRRWGDAGVGPEAVPGWVPGELREFIGALMAADPRQRPSLEGALGHRFLQCLNEEDVLL